MQSTSIIEPIKVYREGRFDRRYWYALQSKRYIVAKARQAARTIDVLFEEHRLELTH